jgi:uncharacterized tellurite resistance protein B-like protein
MFKTLKRLLKEPAPEPVRNDSHSLHVAVASLLHESKRVDFGEDEAEHRASQRALEELFKLDQARIESLLAEGREKASKLTSYFAPVHLINKTFSMEQRIALVEHLWRIAFANGHLERDEDHFVRKIAHLLHVPNTQCMLARSRARGSH